MRQPTQTAADRRRADITTKAAALFDAKGYYNTSMHDIAAAVGVRKPTLYHYFTSKDEILHGIHDEFIELLISRQERREAADLPTEHLLREIMADIFELMETHRGHVRVFFEHHRELNGAPYEAIAEKRNHYQTMVRDTIARGVTEGSLRKLDPELATLALAGMCNWAYQWYRPEGPLASRDLAYVFWDFLMNGLASRSEQGSQLG